MSFAGKTSLSKDRMPCIVIPNIPKLVDERARTKLLCDYDKYESELFKHHIGTPDTTRTIGLKHVLADFDRRVPSGNEPTAAEREWEARKNLRKTLRRASRSLVHGPGAQKRNAADAQAAIDATWAASLSVLSPENANLSPRRLSREVKETSKSPSSPTKESRVQDKTPPAAVASAAKKTALTGRSTPTTSPHRAPKALSVKKIRAASQKSTQRLPSVTPRPKVHDSVVSLANFQPARRDETWNAAHCGQLLRILLATPLAYNESFHLDMRNIDLGWMRGTRYPSTFVTLHTWRDDEEGASVPTINSPRSVLVLLRNGVAVKDLIPDTNFHDADLPQDPEARQLVRQMRVKRTVRRCGELLAGLRNEYTELCRDVNLADVLKVFHTKKGENNAEPPTSIKDDRERLQRVLENERKRFEKHLAFAKDVRSRQLLADERHQQLEEEAKLKVALKKEAERIARERVAERLAAQRKKKEEMEAFYLRGLQERLERADEMNARRIEAQKRLNERRREDRLRLAEQRQERFKRVAEKQEEQKLQILEKHERKEERLQRLREEQEQRQQALHAIIQERNAKSVELRDLARQRAVMHEEQVRQAAMERQQKVEERLAQFQQECEEARARRAQQEEAKRARRKEIFEEAVNKLHVFKEEVMEKHTRHEKNYEETQQQRRVDALARLEEDHEKMEAKAFTVLRKKRMVEFGKLEAVLKLLAKRETAEFVENQRKLLLDEAHRSREAMVMERAAMKEAMARQMETMQ